MAHFLKDDRDEGASHTEFAIFAMVFDAVLVLSVAIGTLRFFLHVPLNELMSRGRLPRLDIFAVAAGFGLLWFLFALFMVAWHYGLYSDSHTNNAWREQRFSLQGCLAAGLLLCGGLYLFGIDAPPAAIGVFVGVTAVVFGARRAVARYRIQRKHRRNMGTVRLLIAGENRTSEALCAHVEANPDLGYQFRGFLQVPGAIGDRCCLQRDAAGTIYEVADVARRCFIDEVVITECRDYRQVSELIETARELDFNLRVLPGVYEPLTAPGALSYLGTVPLIYLHRRLPMKLSLRLKRAVDAIGAAMGIAVLSPLMLGTAVALAFDSGGDVFSVEEYVGKRSNIFRCYKFRTGGSRAGRFVARSGLAGLPQLLNVLVGEMSLVGPRALGEGDPRSHREEHLPCLRVAPGITGAWRLVGSGDSHLAASVDARYVQQWSLWLDLKIFARTLMYMFRRVRGVFSQRSAREAEPASQR